MSVYGNPNSKRERLRQKLHAEGALHRHANAEAKISKFGGSCHHCGKQGSVQLGKGRADYGECLACGKKQ